MQRYDNSPTFHRTKEHFYMQLFITSLSVQKFADILHRRADSPLSAIRSVGFLVRIRLAKTYYRILAVVAALYKVGNIHRKQRKHEHSHRAEYHRKNLPYLGHRNYRCPEGRDIHTRPVKRIAIVLYIGIDAEFPLVKYQALKIHDREKY